MEGFEIFEGQRIVGIEFNSEVVFAKMSGGDMCPLFPYHPDSDLNLFFKICGMTLDEAYEYIRYYEWIMAPEEVLKVL